MPLKTEIDKFYIAGKNICRNQNAVESKIDIAEDYVSAVVCKEGYAYLTACECDNKEVRYSGRVIFNVIYVSEGKAEKRECGVEFSYKFQCENALSGSEIAGNVSVENISVTAINGFVTVGGAVIFEGCIFENKYVDFISSIENVKCKYSDIESSVEIRKASENFKIEDEFDLGYNVRNVLSHSETAVISSVQSGIGCIIADGDIIMQACYLPLDENADITAETRVIPFRLEIECADAMPDYIATAKICVKNVNLKVFVEEAKSKSNIQVEINVEITGRIYAIKTQPALCDFYSLTAETEAVRREAQIDKISSQTLCSEKFNATLADKNEENAGLVCLFNDKIESVETKTELGKLTVSGAIKVCAIFKAEDGKLYSKDFLVPYETTVNIDGDKVQDVCVYLTDCNLKNKNGSLDFDCNLKISFVEFKTQSISFICDALETGEREINVSAISVYVAKENDTLWDVAKTLGMAEEEIAETNKDLTFPLSGEERIVVYREIK